MVLNFGRKLESSEQLFKIPVPPGPIKSESLRMGFQYEAKVENKWARQGVAKSFRVTSRMANPDINIRLNNMWSHMPGHRLPWWLGGKESICQCRRCGFNQWVGKIPGEGNGNLLQYSCLRNPMNRGDGQATVYGVTKELDTTERLST